MSGSGFGYQEKRVGSQETGIRNKEGTGDRQGTRVQEQGSSIFFWYLKRYIFIIA